MAKETYKGDITKHTDWGGDASTGGLAVSGQSVQKYLKNQLEQKIGCVYYDSESSKPQYLMFADDENKDLYLSDRVKYADLLIANFDAPAPYSIELTFISSETQYILRGAKNNFINYTFRVVDSVGSTVRDSVQVTYNFNNSGNTRTITQNYNFGTEIKLNVDNYILAGTNTVTMTVKSRGTNATKTVVLVFVVVELNIESAFNVARAIPSNSTIQVYYKTSAEYQHIVHFYIDGQQVGTQNVNVTDISDSMKTYSIVNRYNEGKHTLQINATMTVGEYDFVSKTLYYEFVISGDISQNQIMISREYDSGTILVNEDPVIYAEQFGVTNINWGYYTSNGLQHIAPITWKIEPLDGGESTILRVLTASTVEVETGTAPDPLVFVPTELGEFFLSAYREEEFLTRYKLVVRENSRGISETINQLRLKLQAIGRTNTEPLVSREQWSYGSGVDLITTEFNNITWDAQSGWNNDSLILSNGATAEINYAPFEADNSRNYSPQINGCTVEIEFEVFNSNNDNDELIYIGSEEGGNIQITATTATLTSGYGVQVKTNYRTNERIKLAFIIMPNNINMTSEPGLMYIVNNGILERSNVYNISSDFFNSSGKILLGNSTGASSIKIYNIRCYQGSITINEEWNNSIVDDIENMSTRLEDNDIYSDSGNNISVDKVSTKIPCMLLTGDVDELINASNKTTVVCDAQWINPQDPDRNFTLKTANFRNHGQSTLGMPVPSIKFWSGKDLAVMYDKDGNIIPEGRYSFKEGAIPMKKWVLQANYMDSTGCHNGSLLRLINDTYYNANVGNVGYALRTPPQKYAEESYTAATGEHFPYRIRIAADSIPCVVFWRKDEESNYSFLGQYVLMDDKKSDYVYGKRSIYSIPGDPYGFYNDKRGYKTLWDNSNTLQYEILRNAHDLCRFKDATSFWEKAQDIEDEEIIDIGETEEGGEIAANYSWEQAFELIYPDPDDVTNDEYTSNANSLYMFVNWLCGTYQEDNGGPLSHAKFEAEVQEYMDIYKMAAYYIFCMRFGLVDNTVRNAQLVTYDRKKWWFEPWDMDIAVGKRNDGHLVFEPRITRQTPDPDNNELYAFAGNDCWLWNAFEGWNYWMKTIVPQVASALYTQGLTYANVINMMDNNYCNVWDEKIYNESGNYKYVQQYLGGRSSGFLAYLQGKGESHRHWWLKTNMDYYDAKWCLGDYTANSIYVRAPGTPANSHMNFVAGAHSFFAWSLTSNFQETGVEKYPGESWTFTNTDDLAVNDPPQIYSAHNISEIDFSELARYINIIQLEACNDPVLGTRLTKLIIGIPKEDMETTLSDGRPLRNYTETSSLNITGLQELTRLKYLDIQGLYNLNSIDLDNCISLNEFYAAGTGLVNFSCAEGLNFTTLELPATLRSFEVKNVVWDDLKFFDSDTLEEVNVPSNLTKLSIESIGTNSNVYDFITEWINYIVDENKEEQVNLTLTGVNWLDADIETLLKLASIPKPQRTIRGYIKVDDLDAESMAQLIDAFDADVFNPLNTEGLVIDSTPKFIVVGNTTPISGETVTYSAAVFPLSSSTRSITYNIIEGTNETIGGQRYSIYQGIKLNVETGEMITVESASDVSFRIIIEATIPTYQSTIINVTVQKRTYPSDIRIIGTKFITSTETNRHNYTVEFTPDDIDGNIEEFSWSLSNNDYANILTDENYDATNCTLYVHTITSAINNVRLNYTIKFRNVPSMVKFLDLIIHEAQRILRKDTNREVFMAMYNAELCSNPEVMYDIEAWEVEELPSSLIANVNVTNFDEIKYFTTLTAVNLARCWGLDGELDLTEITGLTDIDLFGTHTSAIVNDDTELDSLSLGTPTKLIIPNIDYDNVSVQDTSELEEIIINNPNNSGAYRYLLDKIFAKRIEENSEKENIKLQTTIDLLNGSLTEAQFEVKTSSNVIPSDYKEVEYIECTGTQWIDTGLGVNDFDEFRCDINLEYKTGINCITGSSNSPSVTTASGKCIWASTQDSGHQNMIAVSLGSTVLYTSTSLPLKEWSSLECILKSGEQSIKYNNNIIYTGSSTFTLSNPYNVLLFNIAYSSVVTENVTRGVFGKFKNIQYYLEDELVRNYIPCYKISTGIAGLYDTVEGKFYTNDGIGVFGVGPDVITSLTEEDYSDAVRYNVIEGEELIDTIDMLSGEITFNNDQFSTDELNVVTIKASNVEESPTIESYGTYTLIPNIYEYAFNLGILSDLENLTSDELRNLEWILKEHPSYSSLLLTYPGLAKIWGQYPNMVNSLDGTHPYIDSGLVTYLDCNDADVAIWTNKKDSSDNFLGVNTPSISTDGGIYLSGTAYYVGNIVSHESSSHTLEVAFKSDDPFSAQTVLYNENAPSGNPRVALGYNSGVLVGTSGGTNKNTFTWTPSNTFTTVSNQWNNTSGYANKTELTVGTASTFTFDANNDGAYIGCRKSGTSMFKGEIYAIRIYNRALTSEEILYNQSVDLLRFNSN